MGWGFDAEGVFVGENLTERGGGAKGFIGMVVWLRDVKGGFSARGLAVATQCF